MSDPIRIHRSSKKEFTRVSSLLNSKIDDVIKRLEALEKRVAKLEKSPPKESPKEKQ